MTFITKPVQKYHAPKGIIHCRIDDIPISIIDFETTGLTPGFDRVIEVSVVQIEPGRGFNGSSAGSMNKPKLVFDTLVNPLRPVAATEIHGITDADVAHAPRFNEIAGDLLKVLSGTVIAAYNVYFDIKFLAYELQQAGVDHEPPHFCLMYMRPMLGLGNRCRLEHACQSLDINYCATHNAADDAYASGLLLQKYLEVLAQRKIDTYADLASLKKSYKFMNSFGNEPLYEPAGYGLMCCSNINKRNQLLCSRTSLKCYDTVTATNTANVSTTANEVIEKASNNIKAMSKKLQQLIESKTGKTQNQESQHQQSQLPDITIKDRSSPLIEYWDALKTVVADLEITDEELEYILSERDRLGLTREQIRVLHARAFASAINQFIADKWLDDNEVIKLRRLYKCLSQLGWAPGE